MKVLTVHPSGLMYTRVFLRLEPLGLETVAAVLREAGHEVRLIDLQVETHRDLHRLIRNWQPDAVCFLRQLSRQYPGDRRPREIGQGKTAALLRVRWRS